VVLAAVELALARPATDPVRRAVAAGDERAAVPPRSGWPPGRPSSWWSSGLWWSRAPLQRRERPLR
jgi:hypothetical protein